MNSQQAKRIPLSGILERLGHQPDHEVRGELWYHSPFRREAEASFKINQERNIWYDFGEGEGGNVLDFVMKYHNLASIPEALDQLANLEGKGKIESILPPTVTDNTPSSQIEVRKIQPLENTVLIAYLKERGITAATARPHVKEIYYARKGKQYFALAFPNEKGGYELRNPYYKGTHGSKSISLVKKRDMEDSEAVTVFEGFMDFLSALQYYGKSITTPVIVMNSAMMRERTVEVIRELEASKVYLYTQHDEQGIAARDYIMQELRQLETVDNSTLYAGYEDFNDFLTKGNSHQ